VDEQVPLPHQLDGEAGSLAAVHGLSFSANSREADPHIHGTGVLFVKDAGNGTLDLRYRFEKDSLVHTPGKSIRDTQMEQ